MWPQAQHRPGRRRRLVGPGLRTAPGSDERGGRGRARAGHRELPAPGALSPPPAASCTISTSLSRSRENRRPGRLRKMQGICKASRAGLRRPTPRQDRDAGFAVALAWSQPSGSRAGELPVPLQPLLAESITSGRGEPPRHCSTHKSGGAVTLAAHEALAAHKALADSVTWATGSAPPPLRSSQRQRLSPRAVPRLLLGARAADQFSKKQSTR